METNMKEIYEGYTWEFYLYRLQYNCMGLLLDDNLIKAICESFGWNRLYIYGGAYLGIQAYHAFSKCLNVISIVDKKGEIEIPTSGATVIKPEELYLNYDGSPVLITPLRYAEEIYTEITQVVPSENVFYINEIFSAVVR